MRHTTRRERYRSPGCWSAFDHTLSVATAHGYRVVVTLTDQWGECGAGQDGGTSYYKTKDWYINGYTAVDTGMPVSYRDWVAEVVTRYKDSPTVLMWQLINEAEVKESQSAGCLPHPNTESRDVLIAWASDVSGLVKSIDPDHLVSLGTIGGGQCGAVFTQYQDVHAIPTIDLCEYHDYSPNSPMPGDQWNGLQFRIDQCNALNKPLFIGEVGIKPSEVGGTLDSRAAALDAKLDVQMAAGIDGVLSWAWSNLGSTLDNFDIGPNDPLLDVLGLTDNCPSVPNANQADGDGDAIGDVCDNCPSVTNSGQVDGDGDGLGDVCDPCPANPDCDGDGWTDRLEVAFTGTDPLDACADNATDNAWPADLNNDGFSDGTDIVAMAGYFGLSVPPTPARHNIAPDPPDGFVDGTDLTRIANFFGQSCAGP